MKKNKFILTEDYELILGRVELHSELACGKNILGGGEFILNKENKTIDLFRKSHDFGQCNLTQIEKCRNEAYHDEYLDNYKWFFSREMNLDLHNFNKIEVK